MVKTPWVASADVRPDREYLAMASYLPLARRRTVFTMLRYAREVDEQLRATKGLVGFSFNAGLLSGRFWTLSLWEDQASLRAFVGEHPHRRIMGDLQGHMGATKFVQWPVRDAAEPPSWAEGLRRLRDAP